MKMYSDMAHKKTMNRIKNKIVKYLEYITFQINNKKEIRENTEIMDLVNLLYNTYNNIETDSSNITNNKIN